MTYPNNKRVRFKLPGNRRKRRNGQIIKVKDWGKQGEAEYLISIDDETAQIWVPESYIVGAAPKSPVRFTNTSLTPAAYTALRRTVDLIHAHAGGKVTASHAILTLEQLALRRRTDLQSCARKAKLSE